MPEENVNEVVEEVTPEVTPEPEKKSVLSVFKEKFSKIVGSGDEEEAPKVDEPVKEVTVPNELYTVGKQSNFSDEEITELHKNNPKFLQALLTVSKNSAKPVAPVVQPKPAEVTTPDKLEKLAVSVETLGEDSRKPIEQMQEAYNGLVDKFNAQADKLTKLEQHDTEASHKEAGEHTKRIDSYFDSVTEFLPDVGETKSLSEDNIKSRLEIYGIAEILSKSRGTSVQDVLNDASYMWGLGKLSPDDLEKEIEENIRTKLNKQKQKLTPRPGGRTQAAPEPKTLKEKRELAVKKLGEGLKEAIPD